ncbi:cupin domain-containing protein [Pantoea phytobeneficialis]|uniref:Cupin n=1 Tax=Pantoea phytobeneficialis TaxID=2052056 RepID=A0AAP9KRB8_9GAMM|nr:cupin domain-containing protein [Pantoea phytobeneficialis]MDO6408987.1 cupin domain-containing protein [Pantoea phytobeneficialis]QGR08818.1 cupin [Pantoea phytobeneficialis]
MLTNLLQAFPAVAQAGSAETFEQLLSAPNLLIERIVSTGQASPPDFWYCQTQGEWVLIVQGEAGLQLEGELQERHLRVGDFVAIPPGCRHRVNWTSAEPPTVWLAVHYGDIADTAA